MKVSTKIDNTRTLIKKAIQANEGLIAKIKEQAEGNFLDADATRMIISASHENRALKAVLNSLRGNHKGLERILKV